MEEALLSGDLGAAAVSAAPDAEALALAQALDAACQWPAEIAALALALLGDIRLPEPRVPSRNAGVLATLPVLYWVHGLDQAGLLQSAETIAGLWASGAINVPLPDHGAALQQFWKTRRERATAEERAHLLNLVFDERDFEPAMQRLCQTLVALADNAGQQDIREEVGLQAAAQALLYLAANRLEGAPLLAAPDLLAQTRSAVQLLSQRALQTAFAARDFYALIDLGKRGRPQPSPLSARQWAERAQAGAALLRWLALGAAGGFAIAPRDPALQSLIGNAQRWMSAAPARL
jgi:hypothetical protein